MKKILFVLLTLLIASSAYAIDLKDFVVSRDADATPGSDSLLYCVDAPGTTPVGKKCTIASLKTSLEGFLDLENLQGAVTDSQVPNDITITNAVYTTDAGTVFLAPTGDGSGLSGVVTSESDPIVKAITGIVKSNGTTISAAVAGTDYQTPLTADTHYLTPTTAASIYQPIGSYLTAETDPKISTLTNGKWCTTNGSVITCNVDPVTDTNTTYTAGDALTLTGTNIDFDGGATPSGDLGGTWASPTVKWGNIAEGELADSTVVSDDIKDGTITASDLAAGTITPSICFIIDGGGSAIETGAKAWVRATTSFTIGGMDITADQSGSIVVDLWKDSYANFPPTDEDTITASTPPTLSSAQKAQDTTLTGWTTTITAGDYIRANVDSATTVELVEVCIYE